MVLPYRVVSLTDSYFVGDDRLPAYHDFTIGLIPVVPLSVYRYRFNPSTAEMKKFIAFDNNTTGGPYLGDDGLSTVEVTLAPPAESGDVQHVEILTEFAYREPPPPEFRRFTGDGFESWDIGVCFRRECQPAEVALAEWTSYDADATIIEGSVEPITLTSLDEHASTSPYVVAAVQRENVPAGKTLGIFWKW